MNFWNNYWWVILLIVLLVLILLFILRWFQFHHIDYRWEEKRHFPQWSNSGIITRDNYLLRTIYHVVEDSKFVVIGVHSLGGSKEDFNLTKEYFAKQNISFLSFDQRNWGENGKWKYHSLGTTISDIQDIINVVLERFPNQKIILLGDSFGSTLVALALKRLDNQVAAAILTNVITKTNFFQITADSIIKIAFGYLFYKDIMLPINYNPADLSDSAEYVEAVNERNYRRNNVSFTLLYLTQAKKIIKSVLSNVNQTLSPVLIIQTGDDVLADYNKVKENQQKWRNGVTFKSYEWGKHAILNESHTEIVLNDINEWIKAIKE